MSPEAPEAYGRVRKAIASKLERRLPEPDNEKLRMWIKRRVIHHQQNLAKRGRRERRA